MADEAAVEMLPTKGGPEDDDQPEEEYDDQEGDLVTKTTTTKRTPARALQDEYDGVEHSDSHSDDEDAMTKFLDGDRPTSAGEPSHNVPKKVVINPWCISTSILLLIICVIIIITIFAPKLFQTAIQNMLHYMVDINIHNSGEGGFDIINLFMMFFSIFNTAVFVFCGNVDYLLMVSCGYLYGDEDQEWLTGATVYLISNYIGCATAFAIGRVLFKDKLYFLFSGHERYRYFQRVFTDHALLLSLTLNLNPFLPSGLIAYGLSISSMSWPWFLIGQASRIPNIASMAYAGYDIRRNHENDPIENTNIDLIAIDTAYKLNEYTYGLTVTFCIMFALLALVTAFAIFLQVQRLILGDALKRAEEEADDTEDSSDQSVTNSNEDMHEDEEYTTSSESGDTLDEYGFRAKNKHSSEKYLFQDDYAPETTGDGQVADNTDTDIDDQYRSEVDSNNVGGDIEMESMKQRKPKKKSSRHRLEKKPKKKNKKNTKKKLKINNKIWQTIVLASSPRNNEDDSMLFEEGSSPKYAANYNGKQQRSGTGSIAIDMTRSPKGSNGGNSVKNGSSNKGNKAKSPKSPKIGKFNFLKKNSDAKSNDASSPKASKSP